MNSLQSAHLRLVVPHTSQKTKFKTYTPSAYGVPAYESIMKAKAEGAAVATNAQLDPLLTSGREWLKFREAFPAFTGTLVAYPSRGQAFGKVFEHNDTYTGFVKMAIEVPVEFRNERNSVLVAEPNDYELERDGYYLIVRATRLSIITDFPRESGWHLTDNIHRLPQGRKLYDGSAPGARKLFRGDRLIGFVCRSTFSFAFDGHFGIGLNTPPSMHLGLVVSESTTTSLSTSSEGCDLWHNRPSLGMDYGLMAKMSRK